MASPRKLPTAGPRSPRGPEWLLWAGMSLLLVYGLMHGRGANKAADQTAAQTSIAEIAEEHQPQTGMAQRKPVPAKSLRELFFERALAAIQAEEDADKREEMFAALVNQIPVGDIQFTLDELQSLGPGGLVGEFSQRLLRRWAASDRRAAAAWAEQLPAGATRAEALSGVAIEWANASFSDAGAWARQLPDETERLTAMLAVANEGVRVDPVESLRLAVDLPATTERTELICHAAMEWASQDGQTAANWAVQIRDTALRSRVLVAVATSWSESDAVSAATLAIKEMPAGRTQSDAVVGIVQRWAQQQPEPATAWVEAFPEGDIKAAATDYLAMLAHN